jgi:type I restriction enzyme S subunit
MSGEWPLVNLGQVVNVRSGYAFKSGDWTQTGVPVVKIANVKSGRLEMSSCSYVSPSVAASCGEFQLIEDDIVIAMTGYIGDVAKVRPVDLPCVLNQRVGKFTIIDSQRLDKGYLFAFLSWQETRTAIESLGYGSAQPNVSPSLIHSVSIPLPPLPEQRRIAKILGDLDDKIELNRKMNETLEQMARALFKSWFIDFDPVRAKMDGRMPEGMDADTAALFPSRLVESELGLIPEGWEVGVLDGLTKLVIGGDWGANEESEVESVACLCIRGADIPALQEGGIGKMPTRFLRPSSVEKRRLEEGDLAIEISGGSPTQCTGRPVLASKALLRSLGRPLVASNFCRILKLKSPEHSKIVYLWLRHLYDSGEFFQFENGTTGIKNFAYSIFSQQYRLVVPELNIAAAFNRSISPYFERIQENSNQSRTLASLRDTLLPKLMKGEGAVEREVPHV